MPKKWLPGPVDESFVSSLLYSLSHDFGSHVRHVVQFSSMLSAQVDEHSDEFLAYVVEAGDKLKEKMSLLNQLSQLGGEAQFSDIPIRSLFDEALTPYQDALQQGLCAIDYVGPSVNALGRADHWRELINQLLSNAMLYHPDQDKHIPSVRFTCELLDGVASICVADNGIGVEATMFESILRPFKRLQRDDDYPGAGMGLAYCNYIAQLNGGQLTFSRADLGGLQVTYSQPILSDN